MEIIFLFYTLFSNRGSQDTKCAYWLDYGVTGVQFWAEGRGLYLALAVSIYSVINLTSCLTSNRAFPPGAKRLRPEPDHSYRLIQSYEHVESYSHLPIRLTAYRGITLCVSGTVFLFIPTPLWLTEKHYI
jgi:hypothetical protein